MMMRLFYDCLYLLQSWQEGSLPHSSSCRHNTRCNSMVTVNEKKEMRLRMPFVGKNSIYILFLPFILHFRSSFLIMEFVSPSTNSIPSRAIRWCNRDDFFLACLSFKCVFFSSGILFFVWKVYFSWAPNSILSRLFLRSRVASNFSFRFNPRIGFSHLSICPLFRILSCHRLPLHPFSLLCLVSLYTWVSLVVFFTQSFHLCFKITSSNAESILHPLGGLCHMPHRLVKQSVLIFKCLTRTKAPDNNPYTNALLWSSCRFLFHPVWNFN